MLWLQSNEKHDILAELSPAAGRWVSRSRLQLGDLAPKEIQGVFSILNGEFTALYLYKNKLLIRVGHKTYPLYRDTSVRVEGPPHARILVIAMKGRDVGRLAYALDTVMPEQDDMTAFVDDEDFDFGIFLSNISSSEERKAVLSDVWRSPTDK